MTEIESTLVIQKPALYANEPNHICVTVPVDNECAQGLCAPSTNSSQNPQHEIAEVYQNHYRQICQQVEDEDSTATDTDTETDIINGLKPLNHFRWLETDTSIRLNLSGTDWSPRIEIEAVPSGRVIHHSICVKREEKSGNVIPDQKLFCLLNSRNQKLLCIDYSTDLKSFHVMEPDSKRFIAFFNLPTFPYDETETPSPIYIHNVIDGEMYVVSPFTNDLKIPVKSEDGDELAMIIRSPTKWTSSQPGLMTLYFTGESGRLTCRVRAIILGFFLSLGIQGKTHWKRSSQGLFLVYILSALLGCFFVIFIYIAFRNDYASIPLNLARQQDV